jgi:hypothetical protein
MTKHSRRTLSERANEQGAAALLSATISFLLRNNISAESILNSVRRQRGSRKSRGTVREYRKLVRAYEDMGTVMSTWFSHPRFLDRDGHPIRLCPSRGTLSVRNLVRSSRVAISATLAVELMMRSPSLRIDEQGKFVALKRVFVLPDFAIPRAALVIDRYLDTLKRNSSAQKNGTTLLLERNCHVPEVNVTRISTILRDIKDRGTAFMDSVDGDIEANRIRRPKRKGVGELGVLVFAWTRASRARRS